MSSPIAPRALLLPGPEQLSLPTELYGTDPMEQCRALASALQSRASGTWVSRSSLVVHPDAQSAQLALLGFLSPEEETAIERAATAWASNISRLRYVDYEQAERDASVLAARLVDRFGHETLAQASFVGIPRGGLIVLGQLSYALNLRHDQIGTSATAPLLVVVDDCTLTGTRFREYLATCTHDNVVFASLYSHPHLRATLEQEEARVVDCLSAQDLHDHAPDLMGAKYEAWRRRWPSRNPSAYWTGMPDHLCFAWSEPDAGMWNLETNDVERGWTVVPPAHCAKSRHETGGLPVFVRPAPRGEIYPDSAVLYAPVGDDVLVANQKEDRCYQLSGIEADIWTAIVEHGTTTGIRNALSQSYDVDPAQLDADLTAFLGTLQNAGLLVSFTPSPS